MKKDLFLLFIQTVVFVAISFFLKEDLSTLVIILYLMGAMVILSYLLVFLSFFKKLKKQ